MATPQLQQQMFELSSQLSETVNNLKIAEANLIALENDKRRYELTLNEVSAHSDELTKLYKPIGRMFMHFSKEEIQRDIVRSLERGDSEMAEYKKKQETLSKKRDEVTNNIQELISSIRS